MDASVKMTREPAGRSTERPAGMLQMGGARARRTKAKGDEDGD